MASHERTSSSVPAIDPQHLHPADRYFGTWSADREVAWAATVGAKTQAFLNQLLCTSKVKEQGYRSAGALKRMEKNSEPNALEAACTRALDIGASSLSSVRSILNTGLDRQQPPEADFHEAAFHHPNVRGSGYYRDLKENIHDDTRHLAQTERHEAFWHGPGLRGTTGEHHGGHQLRRTLPDYW